MELSDIHGEYKRINGFEDYFITEYGEVYSERLRGGRKHHYLHKVMPKSPKRKCGYSNVVLCRDDGQYTRMIHRLVAEHFVDGYFEGAVVNHIDGNTRNNVASNLEWVTTAENVHKSYDTSGIPATRNYKWWSLIAPDGTLLGEFMGNIKLQEFVVNNGIPASPSGLVRHNQSNGYTVIKSTGKVRNCNDYPEGVVGG